MSVRKSGKIIAGTPRTTGGVEIGDIGFAPLGIDESLNLRRYLNGQVISQSQFTSFTNKIKASVALYPSLATTEENWQSEKSLSKLGQCGKFVIDDTAGTIRLPCVVNAQGLVDLQYLGTIKNESLPNITGSTTAALATTTAATPSGAIYGSSSSGNPTVAGGTSYGSLAWNFNASRSSSTYQNNAPVQQEAVQYPYYIQVATGVEETLPAIREYQINTPFFFGQSMYSDVAPDNASWLVSNGQWNAKSVYPDYYSWLLEQMNAGVSGFVSSTAAYTDYDFVINTTNQTFRLPLLDGSEDLHGNTSIDLAMQASGSTYTASANGTVFFVSTSTSTNQFVALQNNTSGETSKSVYSSGSNQSFKMLLDVKRGDVFMVAYQTSPEYLRFIPAVGNGSLYYYIGDTVQDASLINAGAVLGQLANKADIDASNFNTDGKSLLSGLGMPSNRYIDLTLGASGSTYTAPANGYVSASTTNSTMCNLHSHGFFVNSTDFQTKDATDRYAMIPVLKGTVFGFYYTGAVSYFKFIYAEGEN